VLPRELQVIQLNLPHELSAPLVFQMNAWKLME